jgi:phage FluMu protein Com
MSDTVSHLFQVIVSGPGGSTWKVLVRAVDAESAAGSVRARGHNVTGVQAAAMPKRKHAAPRVTCLKCGYVLTNLPAGDGGEVMCPECGVINTPELPATATVLDEIRSRQGNRSRIAIIILLLLVLGAIAVVVIGGVPLAKIRGWLP